MLIRDPVDGGKSPEKEAEGEDLTCGPGRNGEVGAGNPGRRSPPRKPSEMRSPEAREAREKAEDGKWLLGFGREGVR